MRRWHKELITVLPKMQLLGQWRECCLIARNLNLYGRPNHVLVNKVTDYPLSHFCSYSHLVFKEMQARGYNCDWGNFSGWLWDVSPDDLNVAFDDIFVEDSISGQAWHDDRYYWQCYYNLEEKYDCGAIPDDEWETICDEGCSKL